MAKVLTVFDCSNNLFGYNGLKELLPNKEKAKNYNTKNIYELFQFRHIYICICII